jgi:hypothetical protein
VNFISVEYFYLDGIVKHGGFSMPQTDRTIGKETLYSASQRYLDRLADSTASPFAILQLLDYSHFICTHSLLLFCSLHRLLPHSHRCYSQIAIAITFYLSYSFTLFRISLPSFLYPKVMLHLRVVGQSLHIIIRSGRITSSRECQRFLSRLSFVLCATHASAFLITSF